MLQVTQSLGVPRAYVRMMCELEEFMNKTLAGVFASSGAVWMLYVLEVTPG